MQVCVEPYHKNTPKMSTSPLRLRLTTGGYADALTYSTHTLTVGPPWIGLPGYCPPPLKIILNEMLCYPCNQQNFNQDHLTAQITTDASSVA